MYSLLVTCKQLVLVQISAANPHIENPLQFIAAKKPFFLAADRDTLFRMLELALIDLER